MAMVDSGEVVEESVSEKGGRIKTVHEEIESGKGAEGGEDKGDAVGRDEVDRVFEQGE